MSSKDQLLALGFEVTFSSACQVKAWGKWFVGLKQGSGRAVAGYGDDEETAFADALKTASRPLDVASVNKSH